MASPGLAPISTPVKVVEQKLRIEQALKGSSNWFIVVAALSMVNSTLSMVGAKVHFIFGLGLTQIVDALAHQAGTAGIALDFFINGTIAAAFVMCWAFARKGQKWAWYAGIGLYAVDALILLPFKDYLSVAFHAYALYRMWAGLKLLSAVERLNQPAATTALSSSL